MVRALHQSLARRWTVDLIGPNGGPTIGNRRFQRQQTARTTVARTRTPTFAALRWRRKKSDPEMKKTKASTRRQPSLCRGARDTGWRTTVLELGEWPMVLTATPGRPPRAIAPLPGTVERTNKGGNQTNEGLSHQRAARRREK